ncbi:MAG: glycosyltransferase [Sphaerochaeta sp.]
MRIMVFDVAAESGGAISVLFEFYAEFKLDQKNEYIFILSLPELKGTSNIKVLRFPWIKKSWGHRLYFDHFIAPKLIKAYEVDKVLSLQNMIVPRTKVYQSVFVHNALPFSEYRFSLKDDKLLWFYQNIIGKNIMKSIKKANHVIVQTNWMKKKLIEQLYIDAEKIEIKQSKIDIGIKEQFRETKDSLSTFFFPASGVIFKNHKVIVDACLKLKEDGIGIKDYKVIFTVSGDENQYIAELYNLAKSNNLPIEFAGSMHRDKVFQLYSKSVLVFPSYIETVGLPLVEARMHNTPMLVADCQYSKEITDGKDNISYFDPLDSSELVRLMKGSICKSSMFTT